MLFTGASATGMIYGLVLNQIINHVHLSSHHAKQTLKVFCMFGPGLHAINHSRQMFFSHFREVREGPWLFIHQSTLLFINHLTITKVIFFITWFLWPEVKTHFVMLDVPFVPFHYSFYIQYQKSENEKMTWNLVNCFGIRN